MNFQLIYHLLYRIIQLLLETMQNMLVNCFSRTKKADRKCEIMTIIHRKVDWWPQKYDFIAIHYQFRPTTDFLLDSNWSLYTLSEDKAIFVEMPAGIHEYHVKKAPFFYMKQFETAKTIAKIDLKEFVSLAEKANSINPMGKVAFFTNIPRSGSTLVTQMVQCDEKRLLAFGEPGAFTPLAVMMEEGKWVGEYLHDLLRATFYIYCKNQQPNQTYVLKTQSNGVKLVGEIKQALPNVKHVFQFRENILQGTISTAKMTENIIKIKSKNFLFLTDHFPRLSEFFIGLWRYEKAGFLKCRPRNAVELAFIIAVAPYRFYKQNRECFSLPMVTYENLTQKDTCEETLQQIFDILELPRELVPEGLRALEIDSQGGTSLSREALRNHKATHITVPQVERLKEIARKLDFPGEMIK